MFVSDLGEYVKILCRRGERTSASEGDADTPDGRGRNKDGIGRIGMSGRTYARQSILSGECDVVVVKIETAQFARRAIYIYIERGWR